MAYAVDFLIGLVSFSGDKDDVALIGNEYGSLYRLSAVGDAYCRGEFFGRQPCFHGVEYRLGFLGSRVVGGENQVVASVSGDLCHDGTFQWVAVSTASHNDYQTVTAVADFIDGVDDILESVGSMRIVDNGCDASDVEILEASGCRMQLRCSGEYLVAVESAK